MNERIKEKHKRVLYHYFQTLKDLGKRAPYVNKSEIYFIVGEKMFISEKYAGKIINRLMQDQKIVNETAEMVV